MSSNEPTSNVKRVQINVTVTVNASIDAMELVDWADSVKKKHPNAVVEARVMDMGARTLGIP